MNCSNCQRNLKEHDAFCGFCGQVLPEQNLSTTDATELSVPENDLDANTSDSDVAAEIQGQTLIEEKPASIVEPIEQTATNSRVAQGTAKNFRTVWLIAVFGGWLGIDRFYLGHVGTGVLKLLGAGWYGVWWSVDMVRLLRGNQKDKNGVLVEDHDNFRPVALVISTVLFTLIGLCWLIFALALMVPSTSD